MMARKLFEKWTRPDNNVFKKQIIARLYLSFKENTIFMK